MFKTSTKTCACANIIQLCSRKVLLASLRCSSSTVETKRFTFHWRFTTAVVVRSVLVKYDCCKRISISRARKHFEIINETTKETVIQRNIAMAQQPAPDVEMASETPQSQPLSANQVRNEAGGFVWKVDDFERLRRFLVLGSEGGTYYAKDEKKLGQENAQALLRLIGEGRGPEAVKIIVEYSTEGRTAKQDPIILCLAICARSTHMETKRAAYAAITQVLRIPTHLFTFIDTCETLSQPTTGWGRAHRKAIQKWYTGKKPRNLAVAVTKYKQRNGWSHRDVLRLCHVKPQDPAIQFVLKYVIKGFEAVKEDAACAGVGQDLTAACTFLRGVEDAKTMNEEELVGAIRELGLAREHIPTNHLNSSKVSVTKHSLVLMIRLQLTDALGYIKPRSIVKERWSV